MKPMIKKILYATDLSPNSAYALQYAINSAIRHDAQIVILHVLDALTPTAQSLISSFISDDMQKKIAEDNYTSVKETISERLRIFCEKMLADDPGSDSRIASIEICEGYPAEVILNKAKELLCDVIVMGSHGKGIISQTFLGSVSKRVLRRSRKPVFVIPLPKDDSQTADEDLWTIL